MDKIYSRPRIKIKRLGGKGKGECNIGGQAPFSSNKQKKILKMIVISTIAIATVIRGVQSIEPIFTAECEKEAKGVATMISNNEATEVMKRYEYDDFATIIKDETGNVTMVKANIITINKVISDVAVEIQEELNKVEKKDIKINIGTLTGSKILAGRGPIINFKIESVGDVETDFKSELKDAGINQTLHRLYLDVKCNISILTPFNTIDEVITNQVILAENVIIGTTPDTYYNFGNEVDSQTVLQSIQ